MKLKEMKDTAVIVNSDSERLEYLQICEDAGWVWQGGGELPTQWCSNYKYPYHIAAKTPLNNSHTPYGKNITLAEFKKEQGIMKYSAGDVLVKGSGNDIKVLGVCGLAYLVSFGDNQEAGGNFYTEGELYNRGYTLKTENTKTDMSVSEIEKALGKAAGSLNVVAE